MNGRQGDPIYTQADWSGIGSGIANALGQVFGFGGSPGPQAPQAPQAQPSPSRFAPIIPQALQSPRPAPLPPARPSLATSAPLPPARPADLGQASPAQQIDLPTFDVSAAPMPSSRFAPTPSPAVAATAPMQRRSPPRLRSPFNCRPPRARRAGAIARPSAPRLRFPFNCRPRARSRPRKARGRNIRPPSRRSPRRSPGTRGSVRRRPTTNLGSTSKSPSRGRARRPRKAHGRSIRPPSRRSPRRSPGTRGSGQRTTTPLGSTTKRPSPLRPRPRSGPSSTPTRTTHSPTMRGLSEG